MKIKDTQLLTAGECAKFLKITKRTLYSLIETKAIPGYRFDKKSDYRFDKNEIIALLKKGKAEKWTSG